jgi:hypothetical protein
VPVVKPGSIKGGNPEQAGVGIAPVSATGNKGGKTK